MIQVNAMKALNGSIELIISITDQSRKMDLKWKFWNYHLHKAKILTSKVMCHVIITSSSNSGSVKGEDSEYTNRLFFRIWFPKEHDIRDPEFDEQVRIFALACINKIYL